MVAFAALETIEFIKNDPLWARAEIGTKGLRYE
jgi:hypothetical protein